MKKNFKKVVALSVLTALLTSCTNTGANKDSGTAATPNNAATTAPAESKTASEADKGFVYPMQTTEKLTYWVDLNPNVAANYANLGDSPFGKGLMERTGVNIEFLHPPAGQAKDQFNLIVASGDYPDLMEYEWAKNYAGGPEKAIMDGVIIELSDVISKNAPSLRKYLDENPVVDKIAKTDESHYFGFPFVRGSDANLVFYGPMIRKDLIDKLNVPVPETIDEWYNALTELKKSGVNIPLTFLGDENNKTGIPNTDAFIGAYGIGTNWYLDDAQKVQFGRLQPGFKEALKNLAKWYKEGLIDKDILSVDSKMVTSKVSTGEAAATVSYLGSGLGQYQKAGMEANPEYNIVATQYPVLNKGDKVKFAQKDWPVPGIFVAITTKCKNVELAARLLDYGYTEEGYNYYNFGTEGVSYNMVNGYPTYTDEILKNPKGLSITQAMGTYFRSGYNGPFVQAQEYVEQYFQYPQQQDAYKLWMGNDVYPNKIPNLSATPDEANELAGIMQEVNTYNDEMTVKFILGQVDIDAEWDNYIKNLEKLNIARAIEIKEAGLARYNAR